MTLDIPRARAGRRQRTPTARVTAAAVASSLLLGSGGCAVGPGAADEAAPRDIGTVRSCARIVRPAAVPEPPPPAPAAPPVAGFSQGAADIADVVGAHAALQQLAALESRAAGPATELQLLLVRQRIGDAIVRAMLDVSSVLAEIACENERGDQLRDYLQKIEDRRTRRLGLSSILIGALTAIVSGGLSLVSPGASGGDVAAIVGGTLEASVGAAVQFGHASGELRTERNLMREVWEGPVRSKLFPRSVWRFLNRPEGIGDDGGGATPRQVVVAQWRAGERLGPQRSPEEQARTALLFGAGGAYTIDDLNARDAMLDLLEAGVASMNQDLQLLLDELAGRAEVHDALQS